MNEVKAKVHSQTGASLTFALLLFLVCAVIGSAVLVAGTAAAGRMSKIAESDQRYYSVNSAARLVIDQVDGNEITIIETVPNGGSVSYKDGEGVAVQSPFNSLVKEAAYYYVTEIAQGRTSVRTDTTPYKLNLTVGDKNELKVAIKEKIADDGTMVLVLENGDGTDSAAYAMKLTFSPDSLNQKKIVDVQTIDGTEVTTTTWKIAWHIQNVEIVGGGLRVK